MGAGIHDVLFRLIGDDTDAREAVERTARELQAFSRISAEATADVDTTAARERVSDLRDGLTELDHTTADPKISTDIAGVMAQLRIVDAQLDHLDGRDVDIDINVHEDPLDRLQSISAQMGLLTKAAKDAEAESVTFFDRLGKSGVNIGGFSTQLRTAIPLLYVSLGVIASLVGGLAALAGSLVEAAAGVGALAIAFGGALVPGVAVAIATIKDFKDNMDEAGTTAFKLKQAVLDIGQGFDLSKIAQPVERGALAAVDRLRDLNIGRILQGPLQRYSRGVGQAIRNLGQIVFRPRVAQEWADIISQASKLLPSLGTVAGSVFRILTNIADAAMPFLTRAVQGFATGLHSITQQTNNIGRLRTIIGQMVKHLDAWLGLIKNISGVFVGFVRAVAPQGRQLVLWLSQGAEALSDWTNSEEGRQRIREFLRRVVPLFKELVTFVSRLVVILLLLGESMAPVFEPVVKALNFVLGLLIKFLDWMNRTQHGLDAWGNDATAVWTAIKQAIGAAWDFIKRVVGHIVDFIAGSWGDIRRSAQRDWDAIKAIILVPARAIRDGVVTAWRALGRIAGDVWDGIRRGARGAWNAIKGVVLGAIRGMNRVAGRVWQAMSDGFFSLLRSLASIGGTIAGVFKGVGHAIAQVVQWIIDKVNKAIGLLGSLKDKVGSIGVSAPGISIEHVGPIPVPVPHAPTVHTPFGDVSLGARGGKVTTPAMIVGEETPAHPEYVIPTNPAYRNRGVGLLLEAAKQLGIGVMGYARGGIAGARRAYPMLSGDTDFLPALGTALSRMAQAMHTAIYVTSGYRSRAEQEALYARYLAGGTLAARPGTSEHESGSAADISPGQSVFGRVAGKYGLAFNVAGEPWHIALANAAAGALGAMVQNIGRINFKAPGAFGALGQGASDLLRGAANSFIGRLQPRAMAGAAGAAVSAGAFNLAQLAALWIKAGGPGGIAQLMAHVAMAESGGDPNARNASGASGLWQILGQLVGGNIFNPMVNALNAVAKYRTQGLGAWAASQSVWGRYLASGIRSFAGGLAIVGEHGPELVNLASGTDVHSTRDTQRILRSMASAADARGLGGLKLLFYGDFIPHRPDPVEAVLGDRRFPVAVERVTGGRRAHARQHDRMNRG